MAQEQVTATGKLKLTLKNVKTGEVQVKAVPNLVVNIGKAYIASRMTSSSANAMSHMAIGTSSVTPLITDTALGAQNARVALLTATSLGATASYSALFDVGVGTGAIVEAGIFNASTAGTMLCRTKFDVFNKGPDDQLTIEWDVTIN